MLNREIWTLAVTDTLFLTENFDRLKFCTCLERPTCIVPHLNDPINIFLELVLDSIVEFLWNYIFPVQHSWRALKSCVRLSSNRVALENLRNPKKDWWTLWYPVEPSKIWDLHLVAANKKVVHRPVLATSATKNPPSSCNFDADLGIILQQWQTDLYSKLFVDHGNYRGPHTILVIYWLTTEDFLNQSSVISRGNSKTTDIFKVLLYCYVWTKIYMFLLLLQIQSKRSLWMPLKEIMLNVAILLPYLCLRFCL